MDLVAIRTFCRTVEEGNLTAAAKVLNITKSVASRRIQMLENDLGVKLLVRTTRGVTATEAGAKFYERTVSILADLEEAKQAVSTDMQQLVGTIRLAAPRSFADSSLHDALVAFMDEHPDLKLDMNLTDKMVDISGGGYDVALRISNSLPDTALVAKKLTALRSHVVASPSYLAKYGTPKVPEDLTQHRCAIYANVDTTAQWRFAAGKKYRSVKIDGPLTSNSGTSQRAAALRGLVITLLPRFFVKDALISGALVEVLADWPHPAPTLYALYQDRRHLPLKVRTLMQFLSNWYQNEELDL